MLFVFILLVVSCAPTKNQSVEVRPPAATSLPAEIPEGFTFADGSYQLRFPTDFGAHPDYRTEWWYYTGNLETPENRHFGFELTIFRVGLLPPSAVIPSDSEWSGRDLYFAHFAVSDITNQEFYAFERFSRPGPGLAGAQADPYRVWLEDWRITHQSGDVYQLEASQDQVQIELTLTDQMGVVLHGVHGYSRKGAAANNASYYYSQPRLHAKGQIKLDGASYPVEGLVWKDHEFSTSVLDPAQIGWDWFSLQFEDGRALMIFQLRERDGAISESSSGTFITADGNPQAFSRSDFKLDVSATWQSPHTGGVYPAAWDILLEEPDCQFHVKPWMADQEIHFPTVTYWEGAVRVEGSCTGSPVRGNGYVELTGYAGNLPLP